MGRILLAAARSIRGRLVRGEQPLANKLVELIGSNADSARLLGGQRSNGVSDGTYAYGRTDDLGRFSFGDLANGTYLVRYREPGSPFVNKSVELADTDAEVLVEASEGRLLPVVVVDSDDRHVAGATLRVEWQAGHTTIRTDEQGRAVVRLTSPPKSIRAMPNRSDLVPRLVELRRDELELRIVLEGGLAIRGVVVDDAGELIPRPVVEAQRDGTTVASTTGSATGEFTLRLGAGGPCRLRFVGVANPIGGYSGGGLVGSLEDVSPGGEPVRLVVSSRSRDRSLTVRVLLPDGTPVEGADVGSWGKTDANGERTLSRLPDQPIHLWVEWKTTGYSQPKRQGVVPAGQSVELRFRTANPITGRLVRDDKPVSDARVSIQRNNEALAYTDTDAEGRFRLLVAAEEAGPFHLDVSEPGRPPLELSDVAAGPKNLTVRWKDLTAR